MNGPAIKSLLSIPVCSLALCLSVSVVNSRYAVHAGYDSARGGAPLNDSGPRRLALSSENFHIDYPAGVERRDVETALDILESARNDLRNRLSAASIDLPSGRIEIYVYGTTGEFAGATSKPPWVAGATMHNRIALQPLSVLRRRGVLATTLRHEYAHAVIEAVGGGRTPRWLSEGLAMYFAGERPRESEPAEKLSPDQIDAGFARATSAQELRRMYAAAYREVATRVSNEGESRVWQRIARHEENS